MDLADGPLNGICLATAVIAIRCRKCGREVRSSAEAIMGRLAQAGRWNPTMRASQVGPLIRKPCACGGVEFDSRATRRKDA